jgi:hypothetical protein
MRDLISIVWDMTFRPRLETVFVVDNFNNYTRGKIFLQDEGQVLKKIVHIFWGLNDNVRTICHLPLHRKLMSALTFEFLPAKHKQRLSYAGKPLTA